MRWGKQLAGKGEVMKGSLLRDLSNGSFECFVWGLVLSNVSVNGLNNAIENRLACKYHTGRRALETL